MHPPKATDPHAFPFCARCGAYRHQGACPQPAPLPPPPPSLRSLTPLSAALAAQPPRAPRASQPPQLPPPPPSLPSAAYTVPLAPRGEPPAPQPNPLKPSIRQIVLGVALIALGAWLLLDALPAHRPRSEVEAFVEAANRARAGEAPVSWMFRPAPYYSLCIFSALLCLAGLEKVLRGCFRRAFALTECRYCKLRVWARRAGSDLRCPNGDHLTHLSSAARITLAVLFVFLALGTLGYLFNAGQ